MVGAQRAVPLHALGRASESIENNLLVHDWRFRALLGRLPGHACRLRSGCASASG
jgi:hypothetical protein